jgi:hypothetical protein
MYLYIKQYTHMYKTILIVSFVIIFQTFFVLTSFLYQDNYSSLYFMHGIYTVISSMVIIYVVLNKRNN